MTAPNLDELVRAHLETLEAAPGDVQAFRELENLYEGAARWEDLIRLYEGRARLVPEPGAPMLERAATVARSRLRNVARAEELYRRLLVSEPSHPGALRALAALAEERGDFAAAAEALEREGQAAADPKEAARLALRVGTLHEEKLGRRDRAALHYGRALRLDPGLEEARTRAVRAYVALRRFAQAKRVLDAARDALAPGDDARALAAEYGRLGALLVEEPLEHGLAADVLIDALTLDRHAQGVAQTRERLRELPRTWREVLRGLDGALLRSRDRREAAAIHLKAAQLHAAYDPDGLARAVERLERAFALAPGPTPLDLLARLFEERGDHRGLADALARVAAGTRDRTAAVEVLIRLAQVHLVRFGDGAAAAATLSRALELDPASETAALQLFELHADAGRFAEALAALDRHLGAAPAKPAHAPVRTRAAELALARLGDPARARRLLEGALRADPGHAPAAAALAPLLAGAGEWARLVEVLEASLGRERESAGVVRALEKIAEVQQDRLGRPLDALRTLARALALDPGRAPTRKLMENAAARADAFAELSRAYRSAAASPAADARARKALLRRVAEILDRDLGQAEEAVRAYRDVVLADPEDRGAKAALEAALVRAGKHEELARELEGRLGTLSGAERREVAARLARLRAEAGEAERAAAAWREALAAAPEDEEALWGLHRALEAAGAPSAAAAADERAGVLARLAGLARGPAERAALELERARLLAEPLGRLGEAAGAALAVLRQGGLTRSQEAEAARLLEALLAQGVDPVRIAGALAPVFAAQGDPGRQVVMLETLARALPEDADPRERARHLLDASALRAERLGDPRGALSDAAAALRACPDHAEARRRCEALAQEVGAQRELFALLREVAGRLADRPEEERVLRLRAAAIAEEDLGAAEEAAAELDRALALRPGDPQVLAALTRVALAAERWEDAARLLGERAAAASGPERAALLGQRADVLEERLGVPARAAEAWREALADAPQEARARLLGRLAGALGKAGDPAGQARALEDLAREASDPAEAARAQVESARLQASLGDAAGAAEKLGQALRTHPDDAAALDALDAQLAAAEPAAVLAAARALRAARDPRRRIRALEAEARLLSDPRARAASRREVARICEAELRQASLAFAAIAAAAREAPADADLRREARRLADLVPDPEAAARLHAELAERAPPEARPLVWRELAEWCEKRLDAKDRAAEAWARVRALVPGDAAALSNLRRLDRLRERHAELAEVCLEIARRAQDPAVRQDALREAAAVLEGKLGDLAGAALAWAEVAAIAPADVEAEAARLRLLEALDRPAELAAVLEARLARGFEPGAAERLGELRRLRLGDPAGALALHAAALRAEPARTVARDALAALAAVPGPVGREALQAADAALRAAGEHARRVAAREARLAVVEDPAERTTLLDELRVVLEVDLSDRGAALAAARRAFAEGGPARASAEADLARLAAAEGREGELAQALEDAAAQAPRAEAPALWRRAARAREGARDGAGAIAAWRRLLDLAPEDAEALEALEQLYAEARSARELCEVARRRAALAAGPERAAHLLHAADLADGIGDADAALAMLREARQADPAGEPVLEALDRILSRGAPGPEHADVLLALARAAQGDPARKVAVLLRRAAVLEHHPEPARAVEAYAEVLAESPREPAAVEGLGRLLEKPEARGPAERLLEDVHRLAGDARALAGLLARRAASADPSERAPLLAEVAALRERIGDARGALAAKLAQLREAARGGADDPAARADAERLAADGNAWEELAVGLEALLDAPLPPAAARDVRRRLAAVTADRLGKLDEAARLLEEAAAAGPPAPDLLVALARVHRRRNAPAELAGALGRLADATAAPAQKKELLIEVARIMEERLGDREGAAQAYRKILAVDPEDPNALRLLGQLLGAQERWEDLAEVLAREVNVAERRPNLVAEAAELRLKLGRIRQERLKDAAGALACYRGVLEKVPRHPAALAALEDLARATGPVAVQAALLLEPVYAAGGEHQKVVAALEARAANEVDPAARAPLLRRTAELYAGPLRNPELAFLAASRALAADAESMESLELAVRTAGVAGLAEELEALLAGNADRARDPLARAAYHRQLARLLAGDPARAADAWQKVLDLLPDDREALAGSVEALRSSPEPAALAQALRRALAVEDEPAARARLLAALAAQQEERLGDLPGAVASLKALLELAPDDRDALARLDRLCQRTERWPELAGVLEREIALAGAAPAGLVLRHRLGELRETRLMDREGALALYEEVLAVRPDHPETLARLEALLQKDPTSARAALALERAYARTGELGKQAAVLEVRAGERPDPAERKALWLELGDLRAGKLEDPELAFLAVARAFREDPGDRAVRERLEGLAAASGHEEELAAIYEDELARLAPADVAQVALVLGALYEEKLGDPAAAAGHLRRALALDPGAADAALPALERLYARLERWDELAAILDLRAARAAGAERVALLVRLGQLQAERLGAPDRAAEAFERAVAEEPRHLPALRALEALYEAAGRREDLLANLAAQRAAGAEPAERERLLAKQAALAADAGRLEDAVALWRELLGARPRHEGALAALEDLYERLERWPELAQHLRLRLAATADRREIARLNDKLGAVLGARLGDPAQAIQSYRAVLDSDPRNRRALEALRDIHAAQGDVDGLVSAYRRLVPLQEDAAGVKRVRLELAEVLVRAGQKREAAEQAKLAFDIEPHAAADLVRIEEVLRGAGATQEAVRAAEARAALLAAAGGPAEAVPAWLAVADLWRAEKRPDAAAAALERALDLDPANRTAWDALRELHRAAGNWRAYARACDAFVPHLADPAERIQVRKEVAALHEQRLGQKEMAFLAWSRALAEAPGDADALAQVKRLAGETEAFDELAGVLEQVAEEARGTPRARLLLELGQVRDARLDDADGAEAAFRRALEADPASPEALDALTGLFGRRGRVRDLAIALEQKVEAAAGLEEKKATLLELARIYDGLLHDVDEAVAALRRVLELDGGDARALDAIAELLRREGRWPELVSVLARARDLAPAEADRRAFQGRIAQVHETELQDDEAAVEAWRAVLALAEDDAEALAGLERLYTRLDRFAELDRVYERQAALAQDPRERVRILAKRAQIREEKLHDPAAAILRHEEILGLDGANLPAVKSLERLYRDVRQWEKLVSLMQHHLSLVSDRRETVALEVAIGEVFWKEMSRVDRAEALFNHALKLDPESREAVAALGRLYERSGNWNLALDMLRREAKLASGSKDAVDLWVRMGRIHEDMLMDEGSAREAYQKALALDPGCLDAIRALKGIHERGRDRQGYLEMLVEEARYAADPADKVRLFAEAGRICHEERDDRDQAVRWYEEALKRDPGHLAAARPLADLHVGAQRWQDAERVLDGAVKALQAGGDAKELCRQTYRLGYVAEKLGKRERALASHRAAFELDATYLPALEGLGHLLVAEGHWEEALRIFTAILIHHRDGLTDLEVVETHWQIGEIARKLDQADRAANAYRKALEIDQNHEPSRRSLVAVLEALSDFQGAVEQRQRLVPLLEGEERFRNLVAIGEACRDRLEDPYQAIDAFLAASRVDPTSLAVTEALLGLYKETRQGQKAADALSQILSRPEVQADPARAAKLHLTLAEVLRDEVKDDAAAAVELERALDRNPRLVAAFAALEELLTRAKRWPELEQAYVRMIQRLPRTPDAAQARLALWKTLGELYRAVLRNDDGARTAYQVVARADPDDPVAVERYADLAQARAGEEGEAIWAFRQLVRTGAKQGRALSRLVELHARRREYDQAYSAAQVLAHLVGGASPEEVEVVSRLRKMARDQASRGLDDDLWGALLHERAKGPLADVMTLLALHARPMFVQREKELGLNPKKDELDVQGSMLFLANMFKYAERTLGLSGLRLFRQADAPAPLRLVPTEPAGLVAGEELFRERPKKELLFVLGKAMAFARPELLLARLMPHDQLDLVFQAACSVGTSRFVVTADPHLVAKLRRELERTLPEGIRKNTLKLLARAYCDVQHPGDVRAYLDGAELTSNRAGALLAGDLEVVARAVRGERPQVSKLRDEARLADLAVFCTSDAYAAVRERLGLSVVVPG